jgi:hypothetical protein
MLALSQRQCAGTRHPWARLSGPHLRRDRSGSCGHDLCKQALDCCQHCCQRHSQLSTRDDRPGISAQYARHDWTILDDLPRTTDQMIGRSSHEPDPCPPRARKEGHARRLTVTHGATGSAPDLRSRRSCGRGHLLCKQGVRGPSPLRLTDRRVGGADLSSCPLGCRRSIADTRATGRGCGPRPHARLGPRPVSRWTHDLGHRPPIRARHYGPKNFGSVMGEIECGTWAADGLCARSRPSPIL